MPPVCARLYTYANVLECTNDKVTVRTMEVNPRVFTFGTDVDMLNAKQSTLVERYPLGAKTMLTVDQEVASGQPKRVMAAVPKCRFINKTFRGTVVWIGRPKEGEKGKDRMVAVIKLCGFVNRKALVTSASRQSVKEYGKNMHAVECADFDDYMFQYPFAKGDTVRLMGFPMPPICRTSSDVYAALWCPELDGVDHFAFTYSVDGAHAGPHQHAHNAATPASCSSGPSANGDAAQSRTVTPSVLPDVLPQSPLPPVLPVHTRLYTYAKVVERTNAKVTVRSMEWSPRTFTFGADVDMLNSGRRGTLVARYPVGATAMLTVDQDTAGGQQKRVVAAVPECRFTNKTFRGTVVWVGRPRKVGERAGRSVAVVELRGLVNGKALVTSTSMLYGRHYSCATERADVDAYYNFRAFKEGDTLRLRGFPMPPICRGSSDVYTDLWCPQLDGVDHFVFTYTPANEPCNNAAVASLSCINGAKANSIVAQSRTGTPSVLSNASSHSSVAATTVELKEPHTNGATANGDAAAATTHTRLAECEPASAPPVYTRLYTYGTVAECSNGKVTLRSVEGSTFTFGSDVDMLNKSKLSALVERYPLGTTAMLTVDHNAATGPTGQQKRVVAAVPERCFANKIFRGTVVWVGRGRPMEDGRPGRSVAVVELRGTVNSKALVTSTSQLSPDSGECNKLAMEHANRDYYLLRMLQKGDILKMTAFPIPPICRTSSDVYADLWCPELDGVDHFAFSYKREGVLNAEPVPHNATASCADSAKAKYDNAAPAALTGTGTPSALSDASSHSSLPVPTVAAATVELNEPRANGATAKVDAASHTRLPETSCAEVQTDVAAPCTSASSDDLHKHLVELRQATMRSRVLYELLHNNLSPQFMFNLMRATD